MTFPRLSILGCGWLGLPLAQALVRSGGAVKGSTTRAEQCDALRAAGVTPFHLTAAPQLQGKDLKDFFQSDLLIITIPFKRDMPDPIFYREQIRSVMACVKGSPVQWVIFTSSTSVYPAGMDMVIEDLPVVPDSRRSQVLLDIESDLLGTRLFDATIVRLAGLYGPGRPIGKFFAGHKGDLKSGEAPVNLVHREDAVSVLVRIISSNIRQEIFNVCSDGHPTRRQLYTRVAEKRGWPEPVFSAEENRGGKIVSNQKVKERLRYRFGHPDPLADV